MMFQITSLLRNPVNSPFIHVSKTLRMYSFAKNIFDELRVSGRIPIQRTFKRNHSFLSLFPFFRKKVLIAVPENPKDKVVYLAQHYPDQVVSYMKDKGIWDVETINQLYYIVKIEVFFVILRTSPLINQKEIISILKRFDYSLILEALATFNLAENIREELALELASSSPMFVESYIKNFNIQNSEILEKIGMNILSKTPILVSGYINNLQKKEAALLEKLCQEMLKRDPICFVSCIKESKDFLDDNVKIRFAKELLHKCPQELGHYINTAGMRKNIPLIVEFFREFIKNNPNLLIEFPWPTIEEANLDEEIESLVKNHPTVILEVVGKIEDEKTLEKIGFILCEYNPSYLGKFIWKASIKDIKIKESLGLTLIERAPAHFLTYIEVMAQTIHRFSGLYAIPSASIKKFGIALIHKDLEIFLDFVLDYGCMNGELFDTFSLELQKKSPAYLIKWHKNLVLQINRDCFTNVLKKVKENE